MTKSRAWLLVGLILAGAVLVSEARAQTCSPTGTNYGAWGTTPSYAGTIFSTFAAAATCAEQKAAPHPGTTWNAPPNQCIVTNSGVEWNPNYSGTGTYASVIYVDIVMSSAPNNTFCALVGRRYSLGTRVDNAVCTVATAGTFFYPLGSEPAEETTMCFNRGAHDGLACTARVIENGQTATTGWATWEWTNQWCNPSTANDISDQNQPPDGGGGGDPGDPNDPPGYPGPSPGDPPTPDDPDPAPTPPDPTTPPGGGATDPGSDATNEHLGPKLDAILQALADQTFNIQTGDGRVVNEIRNLKNVLSQTQYDALLSHHRREGLLADIRAAQQGLRDLFTSGEAQVGINWGPGGPPGGGGTGDGDGGGGECPPGEVCDCEGEDCGDGEIEVPECFGDYCDQEAALDEVVMENLVAEAPTDDLPEPDAGGYGLPRGCPAAGWPSMSIAGGSVSMPWAHLCNWMEVLAGLILACGYILGAMIVLRGTA